MTKIKICGLQSVLDVKAINDCGADYAGFVFAKSKRQISVKQAEVLKRELLSTISSVGVFVNEDIRFIAELVKKRIIDVIQLHGAEDATYIEALGKMTSAPIIKVIPIYDDMKLDLAEYVACTYFLFDTKTETGCGGTGQRFDLALLKQFRINKPFFIAGGLESGNVSEVIKKINPYGIDVSSGVESAGQKDYEKIKKFIFHGRNVE
ncbi:MAG TPA: phosphoribosylanthranilate isomerase [Candidatus Avacidaminococcus intestinavium]|uniref:N-(5'-phosphoribosyl)anthranilate isomerase n=1 Tax=Candidatus Avacidaminococcus intestinavium TaxID=2840684 RepID=A0A9D1MQI2_9FIRM|nr:phosphoribosylanthranilate isomerase [Candidatus Avacidaminococcus intestinavium]